MASPGWPGFGGRGTDHAGCPPAESGFGKGLPTQPGPLKPQTMNTATLKLRGRVYSALCFCRQLAQEDLKLNLYPDAAAGGNEARRLKEPARD